MRFNACLDTSHHGPPRPFKDGWGIYAGFCVDNEEAFHHCIVDACQTIRNYPAICERTWRSMMRRVEACIESHGGGDFEHLFQNYSFSYNSQIKSFRTEVDMDIFFPFCYMELVPKLPLYISVPLCV
jgi:hypothetical protein